MLSDLLAVRDQQGANVRWGGEGRECPSGHSCSHGLWGGGGLERQREHCLPACQKSALGALLPLKEHHFAGGLGLSLQP